MQHILAKYIFKILVSCVLVIAVAACSENEPGNALEGTWLLDKSDLSSNAKAYLRATKSAESVTFNSTSAISGNMVMGVEYEPVPEGYMVAFEGMEVGTLYKIVDKNTFEIRVIDVGKFRYIRQK